MQEGRNHSTMRGLLERYFYWNRAAALLQFSEFYLTIYLFIYLWAYLFKWALPPKKQSKSPFFGEGNLKDSSLLKKGSLFQWNGMYNKKQLLELPCFA